MVKEIGAGIVDRLDVDKLFSFFFYSVECWVQHQNLCEAELYEKCAILLCFRFNLPLDPDM